MTQPIHTPYLRPKFPAMDSAQRTKIYGPLHPDGGEYAAICEIANENLARGIAAAYNAFDSAARKLGVNAVELAERMQHGDIAELFTQLTQTFAAIEITGDCLGDMQGMRKIIARVKEGAS